MRSVIAASCLLASLMACLAGPALAADCANPDAIGVSRTIVVDPTEHPRLGVLNYRESLPLNDHEVVLTFDDGPLQPYTGRILDILAEQCIKATFFMVGRMATAYPNMVKRVYAEGHTMANHSQNHPLHLQQDAHRAGLQEIEDGLASIRAALGDPNGVSNFFRIPGLLRQEAVEHYLAEHSYQTWSVDFLADDWKHISASEVVRRALSRIEARGKGILLLHDIQPATEHGLPILLKELKARGYKIVHVVQATPTLPKTASLPEQWVARREQPSFWPHVEVSNLNLPAPALETPSVQNFGIADPTGVYTRGTPGPTGDNIRPGARAVPLPSISLSMSGAHLVAATSGALMPVPAETIFRYTRVWQPHSFAHAARKPMPKRPKAATTRAATTSVSTRGTTGSIPRTTPKRPIGHQIQLSTKPTASLIDRDFR